MKRYFLIFYTLLVILPSLSHTKLWRHKAQRKTTVITISPEDRITYLELNAEQNGKKVKGGFLAALIGALATTGRLHQNDGEIDRCSLATTSLFLAGAGYSAWCAWSQYSNNQEAEELKKEHNITVRHHTGESYLEQKTQGTQTEFN